MKLHKLTLGGVFALSLVAAGCTTTASTSTASRGDPVVGSSQLSPDAMRQVDEGYRATLNRLYDTTPGSRELVTKARAVLVFPRVLSAGLVVGGEFGNGELRSNGNVDGYYRLTTGSVGWQIGAQSQALVFLFMTQDALDKFRAGNGWSGGVDASVALLKAGANGSVDASASGASTVAFVMTNAGLMAGLTLEGTRITRVQ
jgi:lipid-binding SYLF domain-containing protein